MSSISDAIVDQNSIKIITQDALLDEEQQRRLDKFKTTFRERTKQSLDYVVCSPGRVNLIGDHIDYHGFSVLPMATKNSIWLGCSFSQTQRDAQGKTTINLFNTQSDYPDWSEAHSFAYGAHLSKSHKWQHYVLCGYHGVLARQLLNVEPAKIPDHAEQVASSRELLEAANETLGTLPSLTILVDSDLPAASGLSSSSALVCASAVATLLLLHHSAGAPDSLSGLINGQSLADSCSKYEHLVGTKGGGMDQAIIMTAQERFAKYVEFVPQLRCENVHLPQNTILLVAHCGVSYPKASTSGFNTRVLETKLAAAVIVKKAGAESRIALDSSITLGTVKNELFKQMSTKQIVDYVRDEVFNLKNEFSVKEVCTALDMSREQLVTRFETSDSFLNQLEDKLQLLLRCEHVFEEAERVERFRSICDTTTDIALLGQLMTQSHYSLRDKYECSHPALDRLVGVSLDAGALGSRLTGAGWGGCVVTLVEESKCDTVFGRLKEVSRFAFRTEPQAGCRVVKVQLGLE